MQKSPGPVREALLTAHLMRLRSLTEVLIHLSKSSDKVFTISSTAVEALRSSGVVGQQSLRGRAWPQLACRGSHESLQAAGAPWLTCPSASLGNSSAQTSSDQTHLSAAPATPEP
jgi:hypothetical protein